MLKLILERMENDYVQHWNMVQEHEQDGCVRLSCYHKGACDNILRYYAMFLRCTLAKASDRMQDRMQRRIRGE